MSDPIGDDDAPSFVAFLGSTRLASGPLAAVAAAVRRALPDADEPIVVFDAATGRVVDLDLRPHAETPPAAPSRRGRPKLGVVAREVTLLPRHWDWLASQPGGASAVLRRLVDAARKATVDADTRRRSQEAAYRFMSAMAGDLPGFEEASRALFRGDRAALSAQIEPWPADLKAQVLAFAGPAMEPIENMVRVKYLPE